MRTKQLQKVLQKVPATFLDTFLGIPFRKSTGRHLIFFLACHFMMLSPSLRAAETEGESLQEVDEASYILQPGDRVSIKIYPEDEYIKGGEMEVSSEGNITLPLVGKVAVAGKHVIESERAIAGILSADYLVNPEVVMEVLQYKKQSVVILGQVKKPGTYQFPAGSSHLTLLQAISMAGGFSDIANIKRIKVMRKAGGKNGVIHANAESIISGKDPDVELEPGDVIHVSESLF